MSGIPSDFAASSLQAGYHARDVGVARDRERASPAGAATHQVSSIGDSVEFVETTDNDTHVHSDAEGLGGWGRQEDDTKDADDELDLVSQNLDCADQETQLDIQA